MSPSTRTIRRHLGQRYENEALVRGAGGILWRRDGFAMLQSVLAPGEQGDCAVSHFTISEKEADSFNMRLAWQPGTGLERVEPGRYVRLHVGGKSISNLMMSDTPFERNTNHEIVRRGHGRVLIAGLGIGLILHPLLDPKRTTARRVRYSSERPAVEHVTVVEKNPNVIALVKPSLERYGDRLTIVESDIDTFTPGKEKFDTVYFDIWYNSSQDNLPHIAKLHRQWKSKLRRDGELAPFMSSWRVDALRAERNEDNRRRW